MIKAEKPFQLPLQEWPRGLTHQAAFLSLLPADIARRRKTEFARSFDDLDYFEVAILRFSAGDVVLQHYLRAPVAGTVVIVRPQELDALAALVQWLDLRRRDVLWMEDSFRTSLDSMLRRHFVRSRSKLGRGQPDRTNQCILPARSLAA
ncbi:hypothetical protein [Sandarakinorhabdus sp.]|uniref:hypothetical protein n=1 Tax=Sandarakinorhabdus sp. TaxID=1916663 RepID=UPI003F729318